MGEKRVNQTLISKGKTQKTNKNRKYGRGRKKGERYRSRIGKPLGPGVPGNKAGKNHVRKINN